MPQLANKLHERVAQIVAQGSTWTGAVEKAGYKGKNRNVLQSKARTLKQRLEIVARVEELIAEDRARTSDVTVHHRKWIDHEMRKLYDRCIQAVQVYDRNGKFTGEWAFDAKHAVKLLEMFGLEQGMFKRHLDVTSRKVTMIEGSQREILEKFAQLLERLGIPAIAQLCDRLGHDTIVAALNLIGYEVSKENGKDVKRLDIASGCAGDAGESGEPDAQPLRPAPEAARVP